MRNLEIGKTGMVVPALGMGCWAIGGGNSWGDNDDNVSIATIHEAIDLGIKWLDTAPAYNSGYSEKILGEALQGGKRHQVILSTKCGIVKYETPVPHHKINGTANAWRDLSEEGIRKDLEQSLLRLKTDYVDILYTHWQANQYYPIEETVAALEKLKKEGKIRAYGACNTTPDIVREYRQYGDLAVIQEKYNLMKRDPEAELIPTAAELGVSFQAYSPLEQGLLTGKVDENTVFPPLDVRNRNANFSKERRIAAKQLIAGWADLCETYACTPAALVIAFTSEFAGPVHILAGARKPEQIRANAAAMAIDIRPEDMARMKADVERILG